jgi:acetyl esterase/lipase
MMKHRIFLPLWVLLFSIAGLDCRDSYTPKESISDMVIDNLRLDIYRAEGDTSRSRWVLIFAYGGGFWQGSKTSVSDNIEFCKEMAQKGYFVVSINYRLLPHSPAFESDSLRIIAGTPLAGSDVRAAVRFIKSKSDQWPVDSTKIITHGTSSGGFAALAAGVWPQVDSLNFSNLGYSGTPSLASSGAAGLPDTLVVTMGDPPLYLAHCLFDPAVSFSYSENVSLRAQNIGVPVTTWWLSDDCHGIIKCCRSDMVQNLAQWIYDSFGQL